MEINISYDSSVTSAPAGFTTAIEDVVNLYDSLFTNNVVINIDVGWGEIDGSPLGGGDLGESLNTAAPAYSYSTIQSALISTANASGDANQLAAVSTLPSTDPTGGGNFDIGTADAKALGLIAGDSAGIDGYVGFASGSIWSFAPNAAPPSTDYYFIGVAEHEISEVLGRVALAGTTNDYPNAYTVVDLYRFSAAGVRDLKPGSKHSNSTAYFSIDNGTTNLGTWNNVASNGDFADWYPAGPAPGGNDAYNDFSNSGVINALTMSDVTLMNVIGWDTATTPTEIPNGVTGWVSAGQTSSGYVVLSGGELEVGSGGTSSAIIVNSGGTETVSSGGTAIGTNLLAGGTLDVLSGGSALGTISGTMNIVSSGSTFFVSSGVTATGDIVLGGGIEIVLSNGITSNATVSSGGLLEVSSGGSAVSATISSGGAEIVSSGGFSSRTMLSGGGGQFDYGSSVSASVLAGGFAIVEPGGIASATTVSSGGALTVSSGGVAKGMQLQFGGAEYVSSGGLDSGGSVSYSQLVLAGGTASGTTLSGGGGQFDYGISVSASLLPGAFAIVEPGGIASATTVSSGGQLVVSSGGVAKGMQLQFGGAEWVSSGGLDSGGSVSYAQQVLAGGTASGTTLSSGGGQFDYGSSVSATLLPGAFAIVEPGGVAGEMKVSSGAQLTVSSGGSAVATILNGGTEVVSSGGTTQFTTLNSGLEVVSSGGNVVFTTVSGGTEVVSSGGVADFPTVASGGTEFVLGQVGSATVNGIQVVSSGGVASGTTINSGGFEYVSPGGTAVSTQFNGGTEIMSAGATASGTFDFIGNGDLVLDQTSGTFGASISGLTNIGQILDFANIGFTGATVAYVSSGGSGTLTVSSGGHSVSVNLIGTYSAGSFKSANDGSGGIEVFDPPLVPNGGSVTSGISNPVLIGAGTTTAGGLNANEFNQALFANYAAALSDNKSFGSSVLSSDNKEVLISTGITGAISATHNA